MQLAGLVLAAGAGTRFGAEPKLLADLDGQPLLQHVVDAMCAVPALERVVVVLGAHAEEVRARVRFGRAEPVLCPEWERGQAFSLRCGLTELAACERVLVTLGDQVLTAAVVARFAGEPGGTRALYGGRPGHPVVLGAREIAALGSGGGAGLGSERAAALGSGGASGGADDEGARRVLPAGRAIEVGHLCSGRDVDTPEDLEAVRHEARTIL